jgi:hypothetical protein
MMAAVKAFITTLENNLILSHKVEYLHNVQISNSLPSNMS